MKEEKLTSFIEFLTLNNFSYKIEPSYALYIGIEIL